MSFRSRLYIYFLIFTLLFIYLFIYLFLAVLGLRFCVWAFSSCGEWGPLFIAVHGPLTIGASHHRGLSCCGAQAPNMQAQYLWLTGPAASQHVGSSQTRARTRVRCIGRQTLNHCATREAPDYIFFKWAFNTGYCECCSCLTWCHVCLGKAVFLLFSFLGQPSCSKSNCSPSFFLSYTII